MAYPISNLIPISTGGNCLKLTIGTGNTQSAAFTAPAPVYVNVYSTVDCFCRQGPNPTAVADGTDQFIPSGLMYRAGPIAIGNKIAFITPAGTGVVYVSPEN